MKTRNKRLAKSEGQILDKATGNLLRALKREGKIDRQKLREEGYSERLLNKLDEA